MVTRSYFKYLFSSDDTIPKRMLNKWKRRKVQTETSNYDDDQINGNKKSIKEETTSILLQDLVEEYIEDLIVYYRAEYSGVIYTTIFYLIYSKKKENLERKYKYISTGLFDHNNLINIIIINDFTFLFFLFCFVVIQCIAESFGQNEAAEAAFEATEAAFEAALDTRIL